MGAIVVLHDGTIYYYKTGKQAFSGMGFDITIKRYIEKGYNEIEAAEMALNEYKSRFGLEWRKI